MVHKLMLITLFICSIANALSWGAYRTNYEFNSDYLMLFMSAWSLWQMTVIDRDKKEELYYKALYNLD